MDKYIIIVSNSVSFLADIIAIYFAIFSNNTLPIVMLLLCFVLTIIIFVLTYKYIRAKSLIGFIEYLIDNPNHNFNLLPKIIMMLHKSKDYNKLNVDDFTINYEYDFSENDYDNLKPNSPIKIVDTIEYSMISENKKIPEEFIVDRGNMYSKDSSAEVYQKHGIQENYEKVPIPHYGQEVYTNVTTQRYSWKILKKNITKSNSFPLSFKFVYNEVGHANATDTIVFYPFQYARNIKQATFCIHFNCLEKTMTKVDVYQVNKGKHGFQSISIKEFDKDTISNNKVSFSVEPKCSLYEAYYIRVAWQLSKEN